MCLDVKLCVGHEVDYQQHQAHLVHTKGHCLSYSLLLLTISCLDEFFTTCISCTPSSQIERTEEALGHMQEEKERLEMVAKSRRASVANVLQRMLVDTDGGHARSALLAWRLAASRKVGAFT